MVPCWGSTLSATPASSFVAATVVRTCGRAALGSPPSAAGPAAERASSSRQAAGAAAEPGPSSRQAAAGDGSRQLTSAALSGLEAANALASRERKGWRSASANSGLTQAAARTEEGVREGGEGGG